MTDKKRLIIIDSNSLIHRAFHALPPLTTQKGENVGAVYGFLLVFLKTLKEFHPDFLAATFDLPGPTFRHKEYNLYKAKRPKTPIELVQQIQKVKEVLRSFDIPIFEKKGFEADDLIGTIAKLAPASLKLASKELKGLEVEMIVLSGDMDILQLVDSQTKVYAPKKGVKNTILYDKEKVKEKYQGLTPKQLPDFKGLRGDPSDNIPGVPGIGEKNGIELIKKFGSIENLYQEIEENNGKAKKVKPRVKEILLGHKKEAFFSKKLSQIQRNVPIDFDIGKCQFEKYDKEKVMKMLKNLEFYSLVEKFSDLKGLRKNQILLK